MLIVFLQSPCMGYLCQVEFTGLLLVSEDNVASMLCYRWFSSLRFNPVKILCPLNFLPAMTHFKFCSEYLDD